MADVSLEELQLATRNHGMPLEALHHPITPIGLHYLLTHYDIPVVDAQAWRLQVDGCVERPLSLTLAALEMRPRITEVVTMECAGNGRARLEPRPVSQPWLLEAIGTARWSGISLAGLLAEARPGKNACEVVFTGLDRGFEDGVHHQRSLRLAEAMRPEAPLAFAMNDASLPPQHGAPIRLVMPGWYGMASLKWLARISVLDEPFTGFQQVSAYRLRTSPAEAGVALERMLPRAPHDPAGSTRVPLADADRDNRAVPTERTRLVRPGRRYGRRNLVGRGHNLASRDARRRVREIRVARLVVHLVPAGRRDLRALLPCPRRLGCRTADRADVERRRIGKQRRADDRRYRSGLKMLRSERTTRGRRLAVRRGSIRGSKPA